MNDREKIDAVAKAISDEYGPMFATGRLEATPWVEIVDAVLCEYLGWAEQRPRATMNGLSKAAVEKLRTVLVNERFACTKDAMAHTACSPRYNELFRRALTLKEAIALLDAAVAADAPPVACDECECGHAFVVHGKHGVCDVLECSCIDFQPRPEPTCIHCGATRFFEDCPESRSKLHFVPNKY